MKPSEQCEQLNIPCYFLIAKRAGVFPMCVSPRRRVSDAEDDYFFKKSNAKMLQ